MSRFLSTNSHASKSSSSNSISWQESHGHLPSTRTVLFNVGGRRFEISSELVQRYPNSTLSQLCASATPQTSGSLPEVFIDHNPEAFAVILDYIRYDGMLLVPRNVCKETVRLQLRSFKFDVPAIGESDFSLPPAYSENEKQTPTFKEKGGDLARKAAQAKEKRLQDLVETIILPRLTDHALRGVNCLDLWLTDRSLRKDDVATTISDSVASEWIALAGTDLAHERVSEYGSYMNNVAMPSVEKVVPSEMESNLVSLISNLDELSFANKERILGVIQKSREAASIIAQELPDVAYLYSEGVMPLLEKMVYNAVSAIRVQGSKVDLTVRKANDFGMIESWTVSAVKLFVRLA